MNTLIKPLAALVVVGLASPALADVTEHDTLPACYASVSIQCNQGGGCSDEDYNWGLDQCDDMYGNTAQIKPKRPMSLATKTKSSKRVRARLLRAIR